MISSRVMQLRCECRPNLFWCFVEIHHEINKNGWGKTAIIFIWVNVQRFDFEWIAADFMCCIEWPACHMCTNIGSIRNGKTLSILDYDFIFGRYAHITTVFLFQISCEWAGLLGAHVKYYSCLHGKTLASTQIRRKHNVWTRKNIEFFVLHSRVENSYNFQSFFRHILKMMTAQRPTTLKTL